jgi:hypothetical protein
VCVVRAGRCGGGAYSRGASWCIGVECVAYVARA